MQIIIKISKNVVCYKKRHFHEHLSFLILVYLPTEQLGVHENSLKRVRAIQIDLEFGSVSFLEARKTGVPEEKPFEARERINNKLNPHSGFDAKTRTRATLVGGKCSHHCAKPDSWVGKFEFLLNTVFNQAGSSTKGLSLRERSAKTATNSEVSSKQKGLFAYKAVHLPLPSPKSDQRQFSS